MQNTVKSHHMPYKYINILGVEINKMDKNQVWQKFKDFYQDGKQHYIVTPNPENLLKARTDEEYFFVLNRADLSVADGAGLKIAAWMMGENLHRTTGVWLTEKALGWAVKNGIKVLIIDWIGGLSSIDEITFKLKLKFPGLKITVVKIDREQEDLDWEKLGKDKPELLLTSLGAPWQDTFNYHNLPRLPSVKIALGIGGAIDFSIGKARRAPKVFRIAGLEWLWRLILNPRRVGRIFKAVFVFPWIFVKWKFIYPFLYRPNVACLLYRKKKEGYQLFLVERTDYPGHWQIPQGGLDGESALRAGERELTEEIGNNKFRMVGAYNNLYKYKFGERSSESRVRAVKSKKHTGYKGQRQSLAIAEYLGDDLDVRINFWDHKNWKWVDREKAMEEVNIVRHTAMKIFLEKFNNLIENNEI